jgi:diguanylate cyclase (GGDEF)-like protein
MFEIENQDRQDLQPTPPRRRLRGALKFWKEKRQSKESLLEENTALQEEITELKEELAKKEQQIEEMGIDSVTELYNRKGFEVALKKRNNRFNRHSRPGDHTVYTTIVMAIDLDEFKSINDKHGHAGGDRALRAIADVLKGQLRDFDIMARPGGDEFIVIADIPGRLKENKAVVEQVVQRLKYALESVEVLLGDEIITISGSAGMVIKENCIDGSLLTAMHEADANMYREKDLKKKR